jgi:hypothetical protein
MNLAGAILKWINNGLFRVKRKIGLVDDCVGKVSSDL